MSRAGRGHTQANMADASLIVLSHRTVACRAAGLCCASRVVERRTIQNASISIGAAVPNRLLDDCDECPARDAPAVREGGLDAPINPGARREPSLVRRNEGTIALKWPARVKWEMLD